METIASSLVLMCLAGAAGAAPPAALRDELKPMQFLVGSCWTGTFPNSQSTDTHCFEAVYDGKFIRDRHVVRGAAKPYEGETIYAWDAKRKAIVYTYWASDGGLSTGTAAPDSAGNLRFTEDYAGPEGAQALENLWARQGDGGFEIRVTEKKDGRAEPRWRMSMRRDPAKQ
jgi:hypothetical protein